MNHLQELKNYLLNINGNTEIELQGGGAMTVTPVICDGKILGVNVNNLGNYPFLPIDVFVATISLLSLSDDNQAKKGTANGANIGLGHELLPLNSIEGHVAKVVYGKNIGEAVLQRIVPICRILGSAEVCENGRGFLRLLP
ncbi:MAG: hypothetical protein D0531_12155 [Methylococcales bacterium]|nr:MAG: hypothetical protein D0531_12155 [Methylococcales bacterium]